MEFAPILEVHGFYEALLYFSLHNCAKVAQMSCTIGQYLLYIEIKPPFIKFLMFSNAYRLTHKISYSEVTGSNMSHLEAQFSDCL